MDRLHATRRDFLTSAASGLGGAALLALLARDGIAVEAKSPAPASPLAPKPPHFPPRAKNCIFIFLAGGASHIELFDPKPKLKQLSGQMVPESFFANQRFSFIRRDESLLMESPFGYRRYGKCGLEMSELLPHIGAQADEIAIIRSMHTDAFDHAPAEILFSTGVDAPGRPSAGAWLTYGLGSESENLPGYVVLISGRGPVSRSMTWGSGFLPTVYSGVLFRNQGEPVLNLSSPPGVTDELQRAQLDAVQRLNRRRLEQTGDPEIASRIASYELAFRMQSAAPELIDLGGESQQTLDAYGAERVGESGNFGVNCLLARRLVERGVRFVSLFHRRWDHHKKLKEGLEEGCGIVDRPIGALLADLKQRGLLDDTLVVWGTEFGRTPVTQNSQPGPTAGRDHHRFGFSTWLAGGGVRGGQAVGATDELGWHAVEDRVHVHDFYATLLHLFGLDHLRLTHPHMGLDVRLTEQGGHVVDKLLS
jgi:hypothetical protein